MRSDDTRHDRDAQAEADAEEQRETGAEETTKKRDGGSIADSLVRIGQSATLFHDERRDGYAAVTSGSARKVMRIRGREFKHWLAFKYWEQHESAPNAEAKSSALAICEAHAAYEGKCIPLSTRFAMCDGSLYIDVGDEAWHTILITPTGWSVLEQSLIMFRRHSHQQPLPMPERGGSLDDLDVFLNLRTEADRTLVKAWLVTAPVVDVPRPILTVHGAQGSGKTIIGKVLRALLDPTSVDAMSFPRDAQELAQILDHHAVPAFDNLRNIDHLSADMLCRAVTGGGISKRELYSDADDVIFRFQRPILANGINVPTHAPDLLDRMLMVEVERIPEDRRRTEREFWDEFEKARPRLLGALYDEISAMLRTSVKVAHLPRLADFGELAARWAKGTNRDADKVLGFYKENVERQVEEALESDSVGAAIRELMKARTEWQGAPSDLLTLLNERRSPASMPDDWPRRANSLGRRLRTLQTSLAGIGINVSFSKSGPRQITLRASGKPTEPSKPSNEPTGGPPKSDSSHSSTAQNVHQPPINRPTVQKPSTPKPNTAAPLDGLDSLDGSRRPTSEREDVDAEIV